MTKESIAKSESAWPFWEAYASKFIQEDGRVVDFSMEGHSTSEGQAYALFFALVGNDQKRFNAVLKWTEKNLTQGGLSAQLPAWRWGKSENNEWQVLDENAASDADLWISYALIEAARLWSHPPYEQLGGELLQRVIQEEIRDLPGLGTMLLPAPNGFCLEKNVCRLNPSYLPIPMLRRFKQYQKNDLWDRVSENTVFMIQSISGKGVIPDWVGYENEKGFISDPVKGDIGSYDAIRVYLWAGMLNRKDPLSQPLLSAIAGMAEQIKSHLYVPEVLYTGTGVAKGIGPTGFSAAVIPYLKTLGKNRLLDMQVTRVHKEIINGLVGKNPVYYNQNLVMFGVGWLENRFHFDVNGQLITDWNK